MDKKVDWFMQKHGGSPVPPDEVVVTRLPTRPLPPPPSSSASPPPPPPPPPPGAGAAPGVGAGVGAGVAGAGAAVASPRAAAAAIPPLPSSPIPSSPRALADDNLKIGQVVIVLAGGACIPGELTERVGDAQWRYLDMHTQAKRVAHAGEIVDAPWLGVWRSRAYEMKEVADESVRLKHENVRLATALAHAEAELKAFQDMRETKSGWAKVGDEAQRIVSAFAEGESKDKNIVHEILNFFVQSAASIGDDSLLEEKEKKSWDETHETEAKRAIVLEEEYKEFAARTGLPVTELRLAVDELNKATVAPSWQQMDTLHGVFKTFTTQARAKEIDEKTDAQFGDLAQKLADAADGLVVLLKAIPLEDTRNAELIQRFIVNPAKKFFESNLVRLIGSGASQYNTVSAKCKEQEASVESLRRARKTGPAVIAERELVKLLTSVDGVLATNTSGREIIYAGQRLAKAAEGDVEHDGKAEDKAAAAAATATAGGGVGADGMEWRLQQQMPRDKILADAAVAESNKTYGAMVLLSETELGRVAALVASYRHGITTRLSELDALDTEYTTFQATNELQRVTLVTQLLTTLNHERARMSRLRLERRLAEERRRERLVVQVREEVYDSAVFKRRKAVEVYLNRAIKALEFNGHMSAIISLGIEGLKTLLDQRLKICVGQQNMFELEFIDAHVKAFTLMNQRISRLGAQIKTSRAEQKSIDEKITEADLNDDEKAVARLTIALADEKANEDLLEKECTGLLGSLAALDATDIEALLIRHERPHPGRGLLTAPRPEGTPLPPSSSSSSSSGAAPGAGAGAGATAGAGAAAAAGGSTAAAGETGAGEP